MLMTWCLLIASCGALLAQSTIALLETPARPLESIQICQNGIQQTPFTVKKGMIHVQASVESEKGNFILDTGAPMLVINEEPAGEDSPFQGQSCGGEVKVGWKQVSSFAWAGQTITGIEAATVNLSHLSQSAGIKVNGLIGFDLIKDQALLLDYQRECLVLMDPTQTPLERFEAPSVQINFELDGHLPVVSIRINGQIFRFGIDTGAAVNLLDDSILTGLDESLLEFLPMEELQGLDQTIERVKVIRLNSFEVGKYAVSDRFLVTDLSHLKGERGKPLHGLLGYTFLSQFISNINYADQRLLLWSLHSEL